MPRRRPPRPWRPRPTPDELERRRLARSAQWLHAQRVAWCDAVVAESWRLAGLDGKRGCGRAEFERGARSLIDQGVKPPPDWESLI